MNQRNQPFVKKGRLWLAALLLLAIGCAKGPDGTIAKHIEKITEIVEDGTDEPSEAIDELRSYVRDNLPEIMRAYGDALVALDKCEDSDCLDELIEEWGETLAEPLEALQEAGEAFEEAVDDNPAAVMAAFAEMAEMAENVEPLLEMFENLESSMTPKSVCERAADHLLGCLESACEGRGDEGVCGNLDGMREGLREESADCTSDMEDDASEFLDKSCAELTEMFGL